MILSRCCEAARIRRALDQFAGFIASVIGAIVLLVLHYLVKRKSA